MSAMNELHRKSMDFAALALMERARGNAAEASALFEQALDNELGAIQELEVLGRVVEPTYSVLHRSAATLALDCNKLRLAEQLAAKALALEPPMEIQEEIRDVLEQVSFHRHLELRGINLESDEMQMSLSGQGVGFGLVRSNDFLDRVSDSLRLMHRIIERRNDRPFRESGRAGRNVEVAHQLFVSVPRAASFVVTLRFGSSPIQPPLPGLSDTAEMIDEFMDLMALVSGSEMSAIESRIPDPAYLRNFLALAKRIAPDGERVRQVGFTVLRSGSERSVDMLIPRSSISIQPIGRLSEGDRRNISLTGTLRYADATSEVRNRIRVIDGDDQSHTIEVPTGMMNDIVRPMWDSQVRIIGARVRRGRSNVIELLDIGPLAADQTDGEPDNPLPRDRGDDSPRLFP